MKNGFNFSNKISSGFTLVELLLIIGIMGVLSSFAVVNLIRPQTKASLDSTLTTLVSDIKSQQLKAMIGDGEGAAPNAYGIFIEETKYTLFKGTSFNPNDQNNFVVNIETGATISTTFTSGLVIFQRRNGEIYNFSVSNNTITISSGGESKTLTINALGTVSIQ